VTVYILNILFLFI